MINNRGISLISAVIMVVVVGFLGVLVSALFVSRTGTTTARLASMQAQYIAEGGLERGIQQYKSNCTGYTGETNVALGGGRFTVNVYSTSFDGATALSGQARIRSTGGMPSLTSPRAVKVVEQIATCPSSTMGVISKGSITQWSSSVVVCDTQTCNQALIDSGACTCAKENSTATLPAVTVPGGLSSPGGRCEYNGGTFTWSAGTYYCASFHLNSGSIINLTGPVTIYTKNFEMNSSSRLNTSGLAENLIVMVTAGGYGQLNSSCQFKGLLYAPGVNVTVNSASRIIGGAAVLSLTMNSSSRVIWDDTAGSAAPGYSSNTGSGSGGSDAVIDWREPLP